MAERVRIELSNHTLHLTMTDAGDPDLSVAQPPDDRRRAEAAVQDGTWTQVTQVHGRDVVTVAAPGDGDLVTADALVTDVAEAVLAVRVADCVPVAIWSLSGVFAVAHAGWRGAQSGVLTQAVDAVRSLTGDATEPLEALVGYCICPRCYEFGADDLQAMATQFGEGVVAQTADGDPALDMRGVAVSALAASGVERVRHLDRCTSCSGGLWSHRARQDPQRQALVGRLEAHA